MNATGQPPTAATPTPAAPSAPSGTGLPWCECCMRRPAVARVVWPDDQALLCGTCLDDARALGLVTGALDGADGDAA